MKPEPITSAQAVEALEKACGQVRKNLPDFTYTCQNHSSVGNIYPACDNVQWTCGFWPGEIWLAYEHSGDPVFQYAGLIQAESFLKRIRNKIEVDHHDMGFFYTPSCVAAYKLTGNERAKEAAVLAADQLLTRFQPKGGFLQAWGAMGEKGNYRYIIDCLMNLPLLYWASAVTGDQKYRKIALQHTDTCLKYSVREDGSTFHTFFLDPETGEGDHGATCQGYRDDSDWARGQAWAVYGMVPYWDMIFSDGSGEPRDSSSAAIVACGLLEMAPFLPEEEGDMYRDLAYRMVGSLVKNYAAQPPSNGLLLHGTYSKKSPYNTCTPEGVDECVSWGDYFYMEALTRIAGKWDPYW